MKANYKFKSMPKSFWADVRAIGQENGYTVRGTGELKVPTVKSIEKVYDTLSLDKSNIIVDGQPTQHAINLIDYFQYRADVLHQDVEPNLMDANRAKETFEMLYKRYNPSCPIPIRLLIAGCPTGHS